jgi:hypothetical protein
MIGQVIKHVKAKHVVEVTRHILLGEIDAVVECIAQSCNSGKQELNTSTTSRINATFRQRLGILCRVVAKLPTYFPRCSGPCGCAALPTTFASTTIACAAWLGETLQTVGPNLRLQWQAA